MSDTPARREQPSSPEVLPEFATAALKSRRLMPPDSRVVDAWCAWLDALATDAEAALAAAMAYKELDGAGRDEWLCALDDDAHRVGVPRIAMYAPLLAVESDPDRRRRITTAMGPADARATPRAPIAGLRGFTPKGMLVGAIVSPLYLDFVQVVACGYRLERGFEWVRHDPIVNRARAPRSGNVLEGAKLESMPIKALIDELALAVLAHERSGRAMPEALRVFADLFGPSANP